MSGKQIAWCNGEGFVKANSPVAVAGLINTCQFVIVVSFMRLRYSIEKSLKRASWLILQVSLFFVFANAQANDLVVTSKADVGPGTLRAALTAAAANGDASPDRIVFNLPGATEADFTIFVGSQLPEVSSNLVIDGTSQPGSRIAGTINTHIVIKSTVQPLNHFTIFKGNGVHDVEFYGLLMWDTNLVGSLDPNRPIRYGIVLSNAERITIGKAGKGNWFDGYNRQSIELSDCRMVTIAACTFHRRAGNKDQGDTAPIYLVRVIGLNFGEAGAGNVVFTLLYISLANTTEESKLVFVDNNFAVAADGKTTTLSGKASVRIIGGDINPTDPNSLVDILFTGNLFSHYDQYGIQIDFLKGRAVIKHNWFGIDRGATLTLNYDRPPLEIGKGTAIALSRFLGDLQVGDEDPAQGNVFGYSEYGVSITTVSNLLFMRNSFHCISIAEFYSGYDEIPLISVTSSTATAINGTAEPGAIVDLFLGNDCMLCSAEKYIGSTLADAAGEWQYIFPQPVTWYVTANSHVGKKSSNFTHVLINTDSMEIVDARCGQPGAIRNIRVSNTKSVKWVDRYGKVVSTSLDLVGVPPGGYKLLAGSFCSLETVFYDVRDFNVRVNDVYRKTQQPSCNMPDGSIMGLILVNQNHADPVSYRWIDSQQKTVGTSIDLTNVGEGTYFLKLTTASGCETSYGPVILVTTNNPSTGPPLQANGALASITPDDCSGATGGVTGVRVTGGLTPYSFTWMDASGHTVGTQESLTFAKAGTYTLAVADANRSTCNRATLRFEIPARDVALPAPIVPAVEICGPAATELRVVNPGKGKYKLYSSADAAVPLQENNTGVFIENVTANYTYYISFEVGSCTSSRTPVNVHLAGSGINILNTFTPNGDGVNDTWDIANITEYPNTTIRIYNRAGSEVFRSRGYHRPFTGKMNNKDLPVGTYYYLIDLGTGCKPLNGPLTILR